MKVSFICGFLFIILTGCSKYQYVTLSSDIAKKEDGRIIVDNDTLSISYNFSGENGIGRIAVHNKLGVPLKVNLNSVLLTRISWPSPKGPFTASLKPSVDDYVRPEYQEIKSHDSRELAPYEKGQVELVTLRERFFRISTPEMVTGELNGDKIRIQYFDRYKSPLIMVNQVEYTTGSGPQHRIINEFWVDEAFNTMSKPEHVHRIKGRNDMFFMKKGSGFGYFLATLGLFIYLAASHAAE